MVKMKNKVLIVNVVVIGLLLCGQYWIKQQNRKDTLRIGLIDSTLKEAAAAKEQELKAKQEAEKEVMKKNEQKKILEEKEKSLKQKQVEKEAMKNEQKKNLDSVQAAGKNLEGHSRFAFYADDIKFYDENGNMKVFSYDPENETYSVQGPYTNPVTDALITFKISENGTKRIEISSKSSNSEYYITPRPEDADRVYQRLARMKDFEKAKRDYKQKLLETYHPGMYLTTHETYKREKVNEFFAITKIEINESISEDMYSFALRGLIKKEDPFSEDEWLTITGFHLYQKKHLVFAKYQTLEEVKEYLEDLDNLAIQKIEFTSLDEEKERLSFQKMMNYGDGSYFDESTRQAVSITENRMSGQRKIRITNKASQNDILTAPRDEEVKKIFQQIDRLESNPELFKNDPEMWFIKFTDIDGDKILLHYQSATKTYDFYEQKKGSDTMRLIGGNATIKKTKKGYYQGKYNMRIKSHKFREVIPIAKDAREVYQKLDKIKNFQMTKLHYKEAVTARYSPGKYRFINKATSTENYKRDTSENVKEYEEGDEVEILKIKLNESDEGGRIRAQLKNEKEWITILAFQDNKKYVEQVKKSELDLDVTEPSPPAEFTSKSKQAEDDSQTKQEKSLESVEAEGKRLEDLEKSMKKNYQNEFRFHDAKGYMEVFTYQFEDETYLDYCDHTGIGKSVLITTEIQEDGTKRIKVSSKSSESVRYITPHEQVEDETYRDFARIKEFEKAKHDYLLRYLSEKICVREKYQAYVWILIVILVCFTVFFRIFFDDQAKAFVVKFTVGVDDDDFEYLPDQNCIDGAYNV